MKNLNRQSDQPVRHEFIEHFFFAPKARLRRVPTFLPRVLGFECVRSTFNRNRLREKKLRTRFNGETTRKRSWHSMKRSESAVFSLDDVISRCGGSCYPQASPWARRAPTLIKLGGEWLGWGWTVILWRASNDNKTDSIFDYLNFRNLKYFVIKTCLSKFLPINIS